MPRTTASFSRIERLVQTFQACMDSAQLGRATRTLSQLSNAVRKGDGDSSEEQTALVLRVARLAAVLGEAKGNAKDVAGAIAAYTLATDELFSLDIGESGNEREFPIDPKAVREARLQAIDCAQRLCALFRYRMKVGSAVSIFRNVLEKFGGVSTEPAARASRALKRQLPDDPDQLFSYWHYWNPTEAIAAFGRAAYVYDELSPYCAPSKEQGDDDWTLFHGAAFIWEELARKLEESPDRKMLDQALSPSGSAAMAYSILSNVDYPKFAPLHLDVVQLRCSLYWKLEQWPQLESEADLGLKLYHEIAERGLTVSLEKRVLFTKLKAHAFQHMNADARAVAAFEELLAHCQREAETDRARLDPFLADILHNLGYAYLRAGDGAKGSEALTDSLLLWRSLAAQNADAYGEEVSGVARTLAEILERSGRPDLAVNLRAEAAYWEGKGTRVN